MNPSLLRYFYEFTRPDHASLYVIRLFFAIAIMVFFYSEARVSGALPVPFEWVIGVMGSFCFIVSLIWLLRNHFALADRLAPTSHVVLDMGVLLLSVTQDPYANSPLAVLVLAALIDHGLRFSTRLLLVSSGLGIGVLGFNVFVRAQNASIGFPAEAIWMTFMTATLLVYFTVFLWVFKAIVNSRQGGRDPSAIDQ